MKKSELLAYGISEDKIKEFQAVYWADLNKAARRIAERREGGETAFAVVELHEAISAMVRLIPDPDRLRVILNNINRSYAQYTQEQREQLKTGAGGVAGCQ